MATSHPNAEEPAPQPRDARPRGFPFEDPASVTFPNQPPRRDITAGSETLRLMRQRPALRAPVNTLARDALLGIAVGTVLVAAAALGLYRPYLEWALRWLRP